MNAKPDFMLIEDMLEYRKDITLCYSKYSSIREIDANCLMRMCRTCIKQSLNKHNVFFYEIDIAGLNHIFIVELLLWDTDFFKKPMYKIHYILYKHTNYKTLLLAVSKFILLFQEQTSDYYCFIDIPSEDILLIQSLTESSFRLVETRIHQYVDLKRVMFERFPVRVAENGDISNLSRIAYKMRNDYDRFHADAYFSDTKADEYLAKFAEESVRGFADIVIVPFDVNTPPDALFAANYLKHEWEIIGKNVSQLVLAAVSSNTCKGWYIKLLSELCFRLKDFGADFIITNTQSTNRAALHANEKLNFKYGHTTHILCMTKS